MNLNKFTDKAQESVITAQNLASELTHAEVTPEHLLVALVEQQVFGADILVLETLSLRLSGIEDELHPR